MICHPEGLKESCDEVVTQPRYGKEVLERQFVVCCVRHIS